MKLDTISVMRNSDGKLFKIELTTSVSLVQARIMRACDLLEAAVPYEYMIAELAAALIVYNILEVNPEDYKDALDAAANAYTIVEFEEGDVFETIGPLAKSASSTEE